MAKKRKQVEASSDDSDAEKCNRKDERGRTVLAKVGMAIQTGTKIPLEWHPTRRTPCGQHRLTFTSYIGVVARERVCITYSTWKDVPKAILDELYEVITKGFTVMKDRKKWILSRADDRWRAFKTRLRKQWLYKKSGGLRKKPPWKYPWILQPAWDKFKDICTAENFQKLSEDSQARSKLKNSSYRGGCLGYQHYEDEIANEYMKAGIHVDQVSRHETWIRAHSRVKDGIVTFDNPIDHEIAQSINELKAQCEKGEIVINGGRDDILGRAIKKPEHGGHVRGVGSGITNTEYFGISRPAPPSQMRAEITSLRSEMTAMKNNQQFLITFFTSFLNQEQIKQFTTGVSQLGVLGFQGTDKIGAFCGHNNDTFAETNRKSTDIGGDNGNTFNATTTQKEGLFTKLLTEGEDDFYELRPNLHFPPSNPSHLSGSFHEMDYDRQPISEHILDQGIYDCCLAIESGKSVEVVAIGQVHILGSQDVTLIHFNSLSHDHRRVSVTKDIVSTAPLPCPNEECSVVCQAVGTFVAWPAHLIFPTKKLQKQSAQHHKLRVQETEKVPSPYKVPWPENEILTQQQYQPSFHEYWPEFQNVNEQEPIQSRVHLPENGVTAERASKPQKQQPDVIVSRSSSSQSSTTKKYEITDRDRAKVTTGLLMALKKEAILMRKKRKNIIIPIPESVFSNKLEVRIDYEDMLDWCFQKEIGSAHISILMKYLSESCQRDGISGMYGFCDSNYLSRLTPTKDQDRSDYLCRVFGCNGGKNINQLFFAPYHEGRHWMLAAISPWNGVVFWLDPAGEDNGVREFAQHVINEGVTKFSSLHRKDIKKVKKNSIRWKTIQCPRQTLGSNDCGYYVARYMIETIANRRPAIPEEYFNGIHGSYSQEMIDELRDMWTTYLFKHMEDGEETEDDSEDVGEA